MDTVKKWIDRLERAGKSQKDNIKDAEQFKNSYRSGNIDKTVGDEGSIVRVNWVYQTIETIMPAIFNGEPSVYVEPKYSPDLASSARNQQANINYWFRELNAQIEFEDALFDSFFYRGIIQVGWDYQDKIGLVQERIPIIDPLTQQPLIDPNTGQPAFELREKEDIIVLKDQPFLEWIDYKDFRIDPDVRRKRHARWEAKRSILTYEEFKNDKRFINNKKMLKVIKPDFRPEDTEYREIEQQKDKDSNLGSDKEWVSFWEIWDRENQVVVTVSDKYKDGYLSEQDWPFDFEVKDDISPFTILEGKKDPSGVENFSEFEPIKDQIIERVRTRSVQQEIVKKAAPRFLHTEKFGNSRQLTKFLRSRPGQSTKCNNPGEISLGPTPQIPPDLFSWDSILSEDLKNISGLSEFDQGRIAKTATEASIQEGKSSVRRSRRSRQFETFVATVGAKLGGLLQQFQDEEISIKIPKNDSIEWLRMSKEDIQGEFDYSVRPGTMEHINEETKTRNLMRFAEVFAGDPSVRRMVVSKDIARSMKVDPEKYFMTDEEIQAAAPKPEPPKPNIEFEKIKLEQLSEADRRRIVEAAKEQNRVESVSINQEDVQQAQQLAQGFSGGQEIMSTGVQIPQTPIQDISREPSR